MKISPVRSVSAGRFLHLRNYGFTLVELLAVIGIMVLMTSFVVPAFTGMKGAGDVSRAVYDVSGVLDQARTYAMGNGTYVYVGFQEVDAGTPESTVPQISGVGRVAIAVFASKDGTTPSANTALSPGNLIALQKVLHFENLHLADFSSTATNSGGMSSRQTVIPASSIGNTATDATAGVGWPLGSTSPQYTFKKLVQFSPQGVASLLNNATIQAYLEVALQQTRGNVSPVTPSATVLSTTNLASIQIDGITGSNRIYRP